LRRRLVAALLSGATAGAVAYPAPPNPPRETPVAAQLGAAAPAGAGGPRERIEDLLAAVAAIQKAPELQAADKETQRRERVRHIILEGFDFTVMAPEVLGQYWPKLTPEQQNEFIDLFGRLFEASYNRLVLKFLGEREAVFGQTSVDSDSKRALVQTRLRDQRGDELTVDYRLTAGAGRWEVYDVVVDGVSLTKNYRDQFAKIIRTTSYEALLEKIKAKLKSNDSAP
jgi:phospholipid transport system substrate-binding protein